MFARVTKYQMRPDAIEEATQKLQAMKEQILSLPGSVHHMNVLNGDGTGFVVAISESREISDANADKVAALWGQFAEYFTGPPEPQGDGFDVLANWANG